MKGGHHIDIMNIIHDVLEFRRRADVRAQEAALFDSAHLLPLEARMCMQRDIAMRMSSIRPSVRL